MDEGVLLCYHLLSLSRAALSLSPVLARVYGERLCVAAHEEHGRASARQVCETCGMIQVNALTSTVRFAAPSGNRSVQKLRGISGKNDVGIIESKCLVCGTKGAVWSKPKKKRARKEAFNKAKEEQDKNKKKKKKKNKKIESLSSKVKEKPAANNKGFGSLDDWLC